MRKDVPTDDPGNKLRGGTTLQEELELGVGATAGCSCRLFENEQVNGWTRNTNHN